jgi:hypothetical protein
MRPLLSFGFLLAALTLPAHGQTASPDGTAIYSGVCSIPGGKLGARIFLTHSGNGDQLVIERFRGQISRRDPVTALVIDRTVGRISFSVPVMPPATEFPARDWSGTISDDAIRLNLGSPGDTPGEIDADFFILARVQAPDPPYPACKQI